MTPEQKENWRKIKAHLESVGKTDCDYYQRAVAICSGSSDPVQDLPPIEFES